MADYFGEVKWNEDDLRDVFAAMGYEVTDEKVALSKKFLPDAVVRIAPVRVRILDDLSEN